MSEETKPTIVEPMQFILAAVCFVTAFLAYLTFDPLVDCGKVPWWLAWLITLEFVAAGITHQFKGWLF